MLIEASYKVGDNPILNQVVEKKLSDDLIHKTTKPLL